MCCSYIKSELINLSEIPVQNFRTSPHTVSGGSGSDTALPVCLIVLVHASAQESLRSCDFALLMTTGAEILLVLLYLILMEADRLAAGSALLNMSKSALTSLLDIWEKPPAERFYLAHYVEWYKK